MSELPKGWVESSLADISGGISYGFTTKSSVTGSSARLLRITDIQDYRVDWNSLPYCDDQPDVSFLVQSGDIVVARTGATTGKSFLIKDVPSPTAFASYLIRIAVSPRVQSEYVWKFMQGPDYWRQIQVVSKGTAQPGANAVILGQVAIPIPPLAEQKRIVAKLDALNAKSARARTELARIETLVSRYKQAVLSKAFSGELTREWRGGNDWPEPVRLGSVAGSFAYGSAAKSQKAGSVPVLRMGNIQSGKLDWSDLVYTEDKSEIAKYRLRSGDVLFNRTNSPALVGKTALFAGEREAVFAGYLIRIVAGSALNPQYLTYALNSPSGREFSWNAKTDGVSQSNISATKLKEFLFVVPSMAEQNEIVRRIESAFARIDCLATQSKRALELVGKLDEAILAKAFRGELVPQDENDEPAEKLLQRIRAERAAAPKAKRGRGRKA